MTEEKRQIWFLFESFVRGMKLGMNDHVESVHYTVSGTETTIDYNGHTAGLDKIKTARRDGRGSKLKL